MKVLRIGSHCFSMKNLIPLSLALLSGCGGIVFLDSEHTLPPPVDGGAIDGAANGSTTDAGPTPPSLVCPIVPAKVFDTPYVVSSFAVSGQQLLAGLFTGEPAEIHGTNLATGIENFVISIGTSDLPSIALSSGPNFVAYFPNGPQLTASPLHPWTPKDVTSPQSKFSDVSQIGSAGNGVIVGVDRIYSGVVLRQMPFVIDPRGSITHYSGYDGDAVDELIPFESGFLMTAEGKLYAGIDELKQVIPQPELDTHNLRMPVALALRGERSVAYSKTNSPYVFWQEIAGGTSTLYRALVPSLMPYITNAPPSIETIQVISGERISAMAANGPDDILAATECTNCLVPSSKLIRIRNGVATTVLAPDAIDRSFPQIRVANGCAFWSRAGYGGGIYWMKL